MPFNPDYTTNEPSRTEIDELSGATLLEFGSSWCGHCRRAAPLVEQVLAAHPAVFEIAVIGVPDDMMGEKVGAVIVPRPGKEITPEELVAFARERLADFKVPQYVVVRSTPMPRNPGGKMLKPVLRKETVWGKPLR